MKNAKIVKSCRLCGSDLSQPCIKLCHSPLANNFFPTITEQEFYPLEIVECLKCSHYQLNVSIDPKILFKNYSYVSGTSQQNIKHFENSALEAVEKFDLHPGDLIVEIASNDGTLLKAYQKLGMKVVGVEPATNLVETLNSELSIYNEFFTSETANKIIQDHGHPKLVIANNVLAHCNTLNEIAEGIKLLIRDDGYFIFEASYFEDVINNNLFDTIYGEHESYFNIYPLIIFFNKYQMKFYDVKHLENHGGSIRGFISGNIGVKATDTFKKMIAMESGNSLVSQYSHEKISLFLLNISELKLKLVKKIKQCKLEGKKIAIYGCPAKFTTLFYTFGFSSDDFTYAIEDNPLKQNCYIPGTTIKIYSPDKLLEDPVDIIFVGAWNFAEDIIKNNKKFAGTWLIPMPRLKERKNV